jgi:hypothetical protein
LDEYSDVAVKPDYIERVKSSQRSLFRHPVTFTTMSRKYNAYDNDLAVLRVFFDSTSVFQFVSQPSQVYVKRVPGLLGSEPGIFWIAFIFSSLFR